MLYVRSPMPSTMNQLTSTGFTKNEFAAIKRFLLASTVPLVYESGDVAGIQGTGCLFDLAGTLFFVTARHVLEDVDPLALGIPLRQFDSTVFTLGQGIVGWSRHDEFDVAAYRIDDRVFADQLRHAYVVLSPANVLSGMNTNNHYIVPGFPAATISRNGKALKPKDLTQLYTTRYDGPVVGTQTEFDLFFKLSKVGHSLWGQKREVPDLRGISGAPVWQVQMLHNPVWSPESVLRLIGIQVSCDPKAESYIRVLSWNVVEHALAKLQTGN